jgi:hypothetical protein
LSIADLDWWICDNKDTNEMNVEINGNHHQLYKNF